jgi:glutaredoxin 3
MSTVRSATLIRMVTPEHTCPFGVRAKILLEEHGFDVEDRILCTRKEVNDFEAEHGVTTTPQVFINGALIGGCEELEQYLG